MERVNIQWTAKTLVNQMQKGKVNFDNAVQRGLVWDVSRKSLLIHSMIYGYAIPAMYFVKDADTGVYDSLDGKQRSNAISEFINGEFSLSLDTPPVFSDDGDQEDITGMTFEQLPEWAQDKVKDYSLTIYYYEDMTDAEIKEFFRRLNNGKALTAVEITRVNTPSLAKFQEIARHEAIKSITTDSAKKRFVDENIVMQIYNLYTNDQPDFLTKVFREWAKSVSVTDSAMSSIFSGLDSFISFYTSLDKEADKKCLKAIKTRTHFVSASYFCTLAVECGFTQQEINLALLTFFSGSPSNNEEYNKTVGAGSAKPTAVQTRQRVIKELIDKYKEAKK